MAWAATRDDEQWRGRKVISVSGDGGFGQYMGDFNTAVKYGMDITHVLLNNDELGKMLDRRKLRRHGNVGQAAGTLVKGLDLYNLQRNRLKRACKTCTIRPKYRNR